VALFSHGHFLRSLAVRWVGLPVREGEHLSLDPASVSTLGYERSESKVPALSLWNRVGHNP
jgi:probable phosphoglycerate mutase